MALQTSGPISFADIQAEYGGSQPILITEYYRGGTYVPTTVSQAAGSWSSFVGTTSNTVVVGLLGATDWKYSGVVVSTIFYTGAGQVITAGGYNYEVGTLWQTVTTGSGKSQETKSYYRIRRRVAASTISVNTNVPSSGTISMSDFYGGRNS